MSLKRVLLLGVILTVGWVTYVMWSLSRVGDSLSELTSFEQPSSPAIVEPDSESPVPSAADTAPLNGSVELDRERVSEPEREVANVETVSGSRMIARMPLQDGAPIPLSMKCTYHRLTGSIPTGPYERYRVPYGYHWDMSDERLRAIADSGEDGLAQYVYADRILGIADVPGEFYVPVEQVLARLESPEDELFEIAKKYLIEAIRNRNWGATRRLANMYYPFDRVEALAWALINERAGGNLLALLEEPENYGAWPDQERIDGQIRADELIEEFELAPGLTPLEECLGIE